VKHPVTNVQQGTPKQFGLFIHFSVANLCLMPHAIHHILLHWWIQLAANLISSTNKDANCFNTFASIVDKSTGVCHGKLSETSIFCIPVALEVGWTLVSQRIMSTHHCPWCAGMRFAMPPVPAIPQVPAQPTIKQSLKPSGWCTKPLNCTNANTDFLLAMNKTSQLPPPPALQQASSCASALTLLSRPSTCSSMTCVLPSPASILPKTPMTS
jgi:hypothetical protein